MSTRIEKDVLVGRWMQIRGQVKQRWGRLTDSQLDQIQGRTDQLAGLLREHYGYTKARAHQAVDEFVHYVERATKAEH